MSASQTSIGLDLGSRTTKLVWLHDGEMVRAEVFPTGHDPLARLHELKADLDGALMATGYGRYLAQNHFECPTVTEIRACARAARRLCPDCDSALDIGGQDSKAVEVPQAGGFGRFEMNDRCAAGTGMFLEMMADALDYSLQEFAGDALSADGPVRVNSMCTVFAQSEVVSLIARGQDRQRIALGLHVAAAQRVAAMASRVDLGRRCLFVGGVANNPCMVRVLQDELDCELVVPEKPELAVAFGAAIIGSEEIEHNPPSPAARRTE